MNNANNRKLGYSMEDAWKIIMAAPPRIMILSREDPD